MTEHSSFFNGPLITVDVNVFFNIFPSMSHYQQPFLQTVVDSLELSLISLRQWPYVAKIVFLHEKEVNDISKYDYILSYTLEKGSSNHSC